MQREVLGGWSMIGGAILGLVTMTFHPTGGEQATLALAVHAVALVALPPAVYGGWVLSRHLSRGSALSELAFAFYAASAVAALIAATASGFLGPELLTDATRLQGEARAAAAALASYNFSVNQAFAQIIVAATAIAMGLWSIEIARTRLLHRGLGIFGCALAVLILAALLSGQLVLNVRGFGAVVLAQAPWLIMAGAELRRTGIPAGQGEGV